MGIADVNINARPHISTLHMNAGISYLIVAVCLAFVFLVRRRRQSRPALQGDHPVYHYSKTYTHVLATTIVLFIGLVLCAYLTASIAERKSGGGIFFAVVSSLFLAGLAIGYLYYSTFRLWITNDAIYTATIFGESVVDFKVVNKVHILERTGRRPSIRIVLKDHERPVSFSDSIDGFIELMDQIKVQASRKNIEVLSI